MGPGRPGGALADWGSVARYRHSRARGSGRHPQRVDRLRSLLARRSLLELIGIFGAALLAGGLLAAVGYEATEAGGEDRTLAEWWIHGFTMLTTIPLAPATAESDELSRHLVQAVVAFGGVLIPTLFLGAVVFKLFVTPEVFVLRNRIALLPNAGETDDLPPEGHHLAVRFYSGTGLRVIDARATAELHVELDRGESGKVGRYCELDVPENSWPLAFEHMPLTLRIPLHDGDVEAGEGTLALRQIQGKPISPGDFLMLTITARAPELGSEISETHVFDVVEEISTLPYGPVGARPGVPSADWPGWEGFDER